MYLSVHDTHMYSPCILSVDIFISILKNPLTQKGFYILHVIIGLAHIEQTIYITTPEYQHTMYLSFDFFFVGNLFPQNCVYKKKRYIYTQYPTTIFKNIGSIESNWVYSPAASLEYIVHGISSNIWNQGWCSIFCTL